MRVTNLAQFFILLNFGLILALESLVIFFHEAVLRKLGFKIADVVFLAVQLAYSLVYLGDCNELFG
jgi:hypothetical protein